MADFEQFAIDGTTYDVRDATAARRPMYIGTCTTAANTYAKVATVETFPLDSNGKPLVGTVVGIKYSYTNTYKTEGQYYTLEVNSTGAYRMYYNNAELATTTSANTLVAGYKNRYIYYQFNGTQWVWLTASYDTNSTYSAMTQAEVDAGTGTTGRTLTPARLRDNFYTEDEVDTLLGAKADKALVVELTRVLSDQNDPESFTGTFTSNKTYTQITDAIDAGIEVYANDNGAIYSLSDISEDYVQFTRVVGVDQVICRVTIDAQQITQGVTYAIYREWVYVNYTDLATVATSGSYNDLSNKPTIPAAVTVDSALSSSSTNPVQNKKVYEALQGKLGDGDVNVSTPSTPNGTVIFTVGSNTFTINLNHTHDNIPTVDSSLTGSSQTNPVQGGAIYSALAGKEDRQQVLINFSVSQSTFTFTDLDNNSVSMAQLQSLLENPSKDVVMVENGTNLFVMSNRPAGENYDQFYHFQSVVSDELAVYDLCIDFDNDECSIDRYGVGDSLSSYVPTSRKVNNKALSSDITLTASDVGALPSNTAIPTVVNNLTTTTTGSALDATQGKALKDTVDTKADKVTIVTVSTTGAVTQALDPNKFYKFTGSPTSLTVTLTAGTDLCIYAGKFTAGTGFSGFTLPSGVVVADGAPTIEAGGTYEFSVCDNLVLIAKEGS